MSVIKEIYDVATDSAALPKNRLININKYNNILLELLS